ncbi:MAG: hypothetical protein HYT13_00315 [Candidatus Liptonbacteria bacterium]|nr:hypothetical protein [Candidatus Liptonbacteria bacterium]
MSRKKTKQPELLQKSVLSEESQLLLEEIFAFFYNRKEARQDPDICLEAMLTQIHKDLVLGNPISAMLQLTLDKACTEGAPVLFRQWKKTGEYGRFEMRRVSEKKAQTG